MLGTVQMGTKTRGTENERKKMGNRGWKTSNTNETEVPYGGMLKKHGYNKKQGGRGWEDESYKEVVGGRNMMKKSQESRGKIAVMWEAERMVRKGIGKMHKKSQKEGVCQNGRGDIVWDHKGPKQGVICGWKKKGPQLP